MANFKWTEADDAALMELQATCTSAQIAMYLGRTRGAVNVRAHKLRRKGLLDKKSNKRMEVFSIPSTGILLAKTCPKCGLLLPAKRFKKQNNKWTINCRQCAFKLDKRTSKQRFGRQFRDIAQEISQNTAVNAGKEWTYKELDSVSDKTKSNLQLAITLGRTYSSICSIRTKLQVATGSKDIGPWIIHFPKAMKALQKHYIRLGIPDDGWDEVA